MTPTPTLRSRLLPLLGVLILSAPPLLIAPGLREMGRSMENITLLSSQETWLRQRGGDQLAPEPGAWLRPSLRGTLRVAKPPMVVWLHMLAWRDLSTEDATPEQLIFRARLVAAATGLLTLIAVYWIGLAIHSVRLGVIAA